MEPTDTDALADAIFEMVYDGWSDDDIAEEARRLAASVRAEMVEKIASAFPPRTMEG